jgi:hypothetical protein
MCLSGQGHRPRERYQAHLDNTAALRLSYRKGLLRCPSATLIGILFAATVGDIFLTVDWRHVRWIFIQIGSAYAEILTVCVYPVPQFFICIPSLGVGRAVCTRQIDGKSVAVPAVRATAMV